jgi:hypothetical protein
VECCIYVMLHLRHLHIVECPGLEMSLGATISLQRIALVPYHSKQVGIHLYCLVSKDLLPDGRSDGGFPLAREQPSRCFIPIPVVVCIFPHSIIQSHHSRNEITTVRMHTPPYDSCIGSLVW